VKKLLKQLLSYPLIGRPTRKFFWLLLRMVQNLEEFLAVSYAHLPYVKSLNLAAREDDPATATVRYYWQLKDRISELDYKPLISIVLPVYKVDVRYLDECLRSVCFQIYDNWELCIVDDASEDKAIDALIEGFIRKYPEKIKYKKNLLNQHISATSNECIQLSSGEYIALLDHDDRLLPNSLGEMVRHINRYNKPDILYSDERVIGSNGENVAKPYFKPSWSKFMHLSVNYTTHLTLYSRSVIDSTGGFRVGFEGSQDHDLMLRAVEATSKPVVHVPFVLYQWRAHPQSTANSASVKSYAASNGVKAVTDALSRRGYPGEVSYEPDKVHYRVKIDLLNQDALVSIVIPSKDNLRYLQTCIDSIFSKTSYANIEVIVVDNGSQSTEALRYYDDAKIKYGSKFSVDIKYHPFNFGSQINRGAELARGEYLVLLNDDTEIISPDWIEEMLRHAQLDEVGVVGCKLLYRNMTVQNAGIVLTGPDIASSIAGRPDNDSHYCHIMQTLHEVSAISAACLMVKKAIFWEVAGFNTFEVANGYGDVDFCLKIRERNYLNLYTPYARVFHVESPSRGVSFEAFEQLYMRRSWAHLLLNDPYLNFNLRLGNDFKRNQNADYQDIDGKLMQVFLREPFEDWLKYTSH
jgi:O-antigen biosynthesis protein